MSKVPHPYGDRIVLETIKEEKKKGGIILPETVEKERPEKGTVLAVGPGKMDQEGELIPINVKKGDVVFFKKYSADTIKVDEKEYLILKEEDILAVE